MVVVRDSDAEWGRGDDGGQASELMVSLSSGISSIDSAELHIPFTISLVELCRPAGGSTTLISRGIV